MKLFKESCPLNTSILILRPISISIVVLIVVFGINRSLIAQNFINGDFENNSAFGDVINPNNFQFNGFMVDVFSFGNNPNIDIITSAFYAGGPQSGNWYVALHGNLSDQMALRLTTPLIAGECYTISFYDKASNPSPNHIAAPIEIGLSNSNTNLGTPIYTTPSAPITGTWTNRVFTFTAPTNGDYITVHIPGPYENYTQIDNFSFITPQLDLGNDTTICQGQTITLDATVQNVTANTNTVYTWQDNSTGSQYTVNQAGVYFVDASTNGCIISDTIEINVTNTPQVDLGNDTTVCPGEQVVLQAGSDPSLSYEWQDNSTISSFTANGAGTYFVDVSNNCGTSTDTIVISSVNLPTGILGNDTSLCSGDSILLDATWPNTTYLWSDNSTNATLQAKKAGNYWVQLLLDGCSSRDTVTINPLDLPLVLLGNDTLVCEGDTFTIYGITTNATSIQWQDNSTQANHLVDDEGLYWLQAQNHCGVDRDSMRVSYYTVPKIDLGNDTALCQGDSLQLLATYPGASYNWHNQSTADSFLVTDEGLFWVEVSEGICSYTDSIEVDYIDLPYANFGPDTTYCEDDIVTFEFLAPNTTYLWHNGSTHHNFRITEPGTYWVEATNICGTTIDTIHVDYQNCACYVYVPSAFTPNADALNDTFYPEFDCDFTDYDFYVFDRWGNELFHSTELREGWDGTYKNEEMPMGVYVYKVEYKTATTRYDRKFGKVVLVRE